MISCQAAIYQTRHADEQVQQKTHMKIISQYIWDYEGMVFFKDKINGDWKTSPAQPECWIPLPIVKNDLFFPRSNHVEDVTCTLPCHSLLLKPHLAGVPSIVFESSFYNSRKSKYVLHCISVVLGSYLHWNTQWIIPSIYADSIDLGKPF